MQKLYDIIEEILEIPKGSINSDTVIETIEEWDSLANIQIIVRIEEEFNCTIPIEELNTIKKVRDYLIYL